MRFWPGNRAEWFVGTVGCGLVVVTFLLGCLSGCSDSRPTAVAKAKSEVWYCEHNEIKLIFTDDRVHFVHKDGSVAIQSLVKETDTSWHTEKQLSTHNTDRLFLISVLNDQELSVGPVDGEMESGDKYTRNLSGIYTLVSDGSDFTLPIDLDGQNQIDINVEIVPGKKPKVTVVKDTK